MGPVHAGYNMTTHHDYHDYYQLSGISLTLEAATPLNLDTGTIRRNDNSL